MLCTIQYPKNGKLLLLLANIKDLDDVAKCITVIRYYYFFAKKIVALFPLDLLSHVAFYQNVHSNVFFSCRLKSTDIECLKSSVVLKFSRIDREKKQVNNSSKVTSFLPLLNDRRHTFEQQKRVTFSTKKTNCWKHISGKYSVWTEQKRLNIK